MSLYSQSIRDVLVLSLKLQTQITQNCSNLNTLINIVYVCYELIYINVVIIFVFVLIITWYHLSICYFFCFTLLILDDSIWFRVNTFA